MLLVQPFNANSLNTSEEARPLRFAEHVNRFSASGNGVLAYRKGEEIQPAPLAWLDRQGKNLLSVESLTGAAQFSISPDGRSVAASREGDIWVFDQRRGTSSRFTFDPSADTFPIWSPDASRIVFLSNRNGRTAVYQKAANAATNEELILEASQLATLDSWTADGRFLAYTSRDNKRKSTVWVLPLSGERKPLMIQSGFNLREPSFSPDGRWLAYVSDESGKDEIYIETFPPGGSKFQVSIDGGARPKWRPDGRELFYVSPERVLMTVPIRLDAKSAELGVPQALIYNLSRGAYELSPDGQRFLMSSPVEDRPSIPIDVVINWPSEIRIK
jgi:Tol biopolymer transport system component